MTAKSKPGRAVVPRRPDITPAQLHILQHSLGLDQYGQGNAYRNHYVTDPKGPDGLVCESLCALGLMQRRGRSALSGGDMLYLVTDAGRTAVIEQSPKPPKLSRSKLRYQEFLEADSGMKFFDWLKYNQAWKKRDRERLYA